MIRVLHTGLSLPEKRKGITLDHRPLLEVSFLKIEQKDLEGEHDAMCFFSPRAVDSLFIQKIDLPDIRTFVVGTKTKEKLKVCYDVDAESFLDFKDFSNYYKGERLLSFELLGSPRSVAALSEGTHGNPCKVIPVYQTHFRNSSAIDLSLFDWIIFTSPKGVESFLSQVDLAAFQGEVACVGGSTYTALFQRGIFPRFEKVGSLPVEALLDKIQESG